MKKSISSIAKKVAIGAGVVGATWIGVKKSADNHNGNIAQKPKIQKVEPCAIPQKPQVSKKRDMVARDADYATYRMRMQQELDAYKKQMDNDFEEYKKQLNQKFAAYKQEIERKMEPDSARRAKNEEFVRAMRNPKNWKRVGPQAVHQNHPIKTEKQR